jgi:hypothetical protein
MKNPHSSVRYSFIARARALVVCAADRASGIQTPRSMAWN